MDDIGIEAEGMMIRGRSGLMSGRGALCALVVVVYILSGSAVLDLACRAGDIGGVESGFEIVRLLVSPGEGDGAMGFGERSV